MGNVYKGITKNRQRKNRGCVPPLPLRPNIIQVGRRQSQAMSAAGLIGLEVATGKHGDRCKRGWTMPENRVGVVVSSTTTFVHGVPKTLPIRIQIKKTSSARLVRLVPMMAA